MQKPICSKYQPGSESSERGRVALPEITHSPSWASLRLPAGLPVTPRATALPAPGCHWEPQLPGASSSCITIFTRPDLWSRLIMIWKWAGAWTSPLEKRRPGMGLGFPAAWLCAGGNLEAQAPGGRPWQLSSCGFIAGILSPPHSYTRIPPSSAVTPETSLRLTLPVPETPPPPPAHL